MHSVITENIENEETDGKVQEEAKEKRKIKEETMKLKQNI